MSIALCCCLPVKGAWLYETFNTTALFLTYSSSVPSEKSFGNIYIAGHNQKNGEEKLGGVELSTRSYCPSYQDFPMIQDINPFWFCFLHNVVSLFFFLKPQPIKH